MNIDKFQQDHANVMAAVAELRRLVQGGISSNADTIAKTIVSMSASIKLHLATEDKVLYPALIGSGDKVVSGLAIAFQSDMGAIATAYGEFSRRWNLGSKVAADPEGFRSEADRIFKALHRRIQRENQELYPLAETV
jgi:hemerythrin-like domain-containing protein